MTLYYTPNYRTQEQLTQMVELEAAGVCIFCPEHLAESELIVYNTPLWTVAKNRFPYRGTQLHYLLLPDEHVEDMADLSPESQLDFWTAVRWVKATHNLTHYGLVARNGDCAFTGGTIRHLHVHIVQGDVENSEFTAIRVKLSSHPGEIHPDKLNISRP